MQRSVTNDGDMKGEEVSIDGMNGRNKDDWCHTTCNLFVLSSHIHMKMNFLVKNALQ